MAGGSWAKGAVSWVAASALLETVLAAVALVVTEAFAVFAAVFFCAVFSGCGAGSAEGVAVAIGFWLVNISRMPRAAEALCSARVRRVSPMGLSRIGLTGTTLLSGTMKVAVGECR